jgi:hypothetical protein
LDLVQSYSPKWHKISKNVGIEVKFRWETDSFHFRIENFHFGLGIQSFHEG